MKKIAFGSLMIFLTFPLYAENEALDIIGGDAEQIYDELTIDEVEGVRRPDRDLSVHVKELSGLHCVVTTRGRRSDYRCHLKANLTEKEIGEIYEALHSNLEEVEHPIVIGSSRWVKRLSAFTVRKSVVVYPNAKPIYSIEVIRTLTVIVEGKNAKVIYDALSVTPRNNFSGPSKTAGPLHCMTAMRTRDPHLYSCDLTGEDATEGSGRTAVIVWKEDARKIYEALDVKEKKGEDPFLTFFKHVGALNCSRSRVLGEENYSCTLQE